jgi:hypothetical protein
MSAQAAAPWREGVGGGGGGGLGWWSWRRGSVSLPELTFIGFALVFILFFTGDSPVPVMPYAGPFAPGSSTSIAAAAAS